MATESGTWKFASPIGLFHCGPLAARVDVAKPELGLLDLRIDGAAVAGSLFSVQWLDESSDQKHGSGGWPMKLADAYVRGGDLVATYERMPNWPFAPQIYWSGEHGAGSTEPRSSRAGEAPCLLTLLVSIQTDSLDTHPCIRVTSRLAADELIHVEQEGASKHPSSPPVPAPWSLPPASCLLWRLPGGKLSYAQFVAASDFRQLSVEHDAHGLACVHWDLFAEFLEKGVIRRARIQSILLPRKDDVKLAAAYCEALASRPLPLTT